MHVRPNGIDAELKKDKNGYTPLQYLSEQTSLASILALQHIDHVAQEVEMTDSAMVCLRTHSSLFTSKLFKFSCVIHKMVIKWQEL